MTKEMLINTVENQECRIAVLIDGVLEELYIERVSSASHVGNIYKGRITNVESAIQAAFVDFGLGKNGFLHISDVHPKYFPRSQKNATEAVGKKRPHRDRPPIQDCLRRGQEVVVQMTKEGIGTKGPTLTTYLSIPGRLLVMMPGMSRLGVSRKVEDDDARGKAREILAELNPPGDMGFIVRTAGLDKPKKDLQRDMNYLLRLWQAVKHSIKTCRSPAEIYQESDLVIRTLRDVYNSDIERIVCDNEAVATRVQEFLQVAVPKGKNVVELYSGREGLFHDSGLEAEIEKIYSRRVELSVGGSLVIDQAEALVAIDVNSGRFREHNDAETTATKINQIAAREIARQLRLRDLGGVIVMDFIDMREEKNRRSVEKTLRDAIKTDRAKTKLTKISAFGIIEMTRQRIRPSLQRSIYRTCSHCDGSGLIKSEETVALMAIRSLQRAAVLDDVARIEIQVTPSVAHHLANQERRQIAELERVSGKTIIIQANPDLLAQEVNFICTSARGTPVAWHADPTKPQARKPMQTVALPPLPERPEEELEDLEGFADEAVAEEAHDERAMELATRAAATIEEATALVDEPRAPAAPPAAGQAQAPARPAAQAGPGTAPQAGQAGPPPQGAEGEGKRRRRGRRGGRRHKKHQAALAAAQAGQPPQAGLPAQAGQGPGMPVVPVEPRAPYVPADEPAHPSQGPAAPPAPQEPAPATPSSPEEANKVLQAIKEFVDREARKVLQAEQVFASTVRAAAQPHQQPTNQSPAGGEQMPAHPAEPAPQTVTQSAPAEFAQVPAETAPVSVPPSPQTPSKGVPEQKPEDVPAGVVPAPAPSQAGAPPAPADGDAHHRTRRGRRGGRRHKKPDATTPAPVPGESQPKAEAKPREQKPVQAQKQPAPKQKQPAPSPAGEKTAKPRRRRPPRKGRTEGQTGTKGPADAKGPAETKGQAEKQS